MHTFAIVAHKESAHLQECADSLKKQTIPSDIILCTSTPNVFLENIAKKNGLRLFVNSEKDGIVNDWNFALREATTKYITLTHQDDVYYPTYAEEFMKAAESRKDALIIFSNYNELICKNDQICVRKNSLNFFVKKIILYLSFRKKHYIIRNKKRLLVFGNPIGCPTVAFNKESIGAFQFDRVFSINMDWKAWHDLAQEEGSFIWIKKTLVSHRIYSGSETSRGLAENRRQKEDLEMFEKFWPVDLARLINKFYSLSYKNNSN